MKSHNLKFIVLIQLTNQMHGEWWQMNTKDFRVSNCEWYFVFKKATTKTLPKQYFEIHVVRMSKLYSLMVQHYSKEMGTPSKLQVCLWTWNFDFSSDFFIDIFIHGFICESFYIWLSLYSTIIYHLWLSRLTNFINSTGPWNMHSL